jgi:hypothetical protein
LTPVGVPTPVFSLVDPTRVASIVLLYVVNLGWRIGFHHAIAVPLARVYYSDSVPPRRRRRRMMWIRSKSICVVLQPTW